MKIIYVLWFMIFSFKVSLGQSISYSVDSLSHRYFFKLDEVSQSVFKKILKHREEVAYLNRLDSLNYDYAFIEETINIQDGLVKTVERYFNISDSLFETIKFHENEKKLKVVLPKMFYIDGKQVVLGFHYYQTCVAYTYFYGIYEFYYTLDTLLNNFQSCKPIQEMVYDKTPSIVMMKGSDTLNTETNNAIIEEKLKGTYQLITLINKKANRTIVSYQLPPLIPIVDVEKIELAHYDW